MVVLCRLWTRRPEEGLRSRYCSFRDGSTNLRRRIMALVALKIGIE
jgi:hypothetical protein